MSDGGHEKSSTSIYLRDDLAEWMDANGYNRSDLINQLLESFRGSGAVDAVGEQYRLREERAKLEALEERAGVKRDLVESLEQTTTTPEQKRQRALDGLLEEVAPPEQIHYPRDHTRIRRLAAEHFGGDVDAAIAALHERNEDCEVVDPEVLPDR